VEEKSRLIGGRYRLKAKVGQGAMGVVWQAYDEQLHRVVAAKELLALDGLDDAKVDRAIARAMREARLAARLEHPNAIRVYDVVEEHGQPWLIMEYLPSRSLAAVIAEQGTLPPREVARIGCYTAAALAAAHRHGIQHRDVKPGNVLIGDQEVKITDFGISRATGDDGTATATGTVGTPAFFSPEVARGEDAGFASDVFSLGATLYNAVEGGPPFGTADNHIAMLHRVASGSIMPPANAGPLLAPVLFRLLANEPERRPSMEEAVHLLAAVVNESPQGSEATAVIPATVELPAEAQPEEKAKQEAGAAAAGLVAAAAAAEAAKLTAPPAAPEPEQPVEEPAAAAPTPAAALQEVVAPPPVQPEAEKRRKFPLVPIAIVLLVLAVGVGSFLLWPKDKGHNAQPPPSSASSSPPAAPTTSQTQTQTQTTTQTTAEPPAQTTTNPPVNPPNPPANSQTAAQALQAYYALVPGNLEAGYATLTDSFKAAMVPSFQKYQSFWSQYTSVQLSNVTQQGDNVVSATLQYMQGSAVVTTERNTYTLVQQNGKWMIDKQVSG